MAAILNKKIIKQFEQIVGAKNVLMQIGDLQLYSFDSALDRSLPSAVVLPGTPGELSKIIQILAKAKLPYVIRGAATSLCGGPIPLNNAVVIGTARLKKISELDKRTNQIQAEPGVINLKIQNAVSKHNLFYAPDPGSQKACTIGGNVATNAGGPHCLKYGVTSNSVVGLDWILPDGQLLKLHVDNPGFDLVGFFVGSEGTLGTAARATLQLQTKPAHVQTMVVSFKSMEEAIQSVTDIISAGILPATLEAMDKTIIEAVEAFMQAGYPLEAEAVLLIEVDGSSLKVLEEQVQRIKQVCEKNNSFQFQAAKTEEERQKLWEGRRGSYASMARLAPNVLVEDGAVPRTKLPEALKKLKEISARHNVRTSLLFHAGDGNLHPQIIFDERDPKQTQIVKKAGYEMLKACVDLGGTISGEHGIGVDKREAMKWLFSRETLSLFRRLKNVFDPLNIANPDKLIPLVSKAPGSQTDKFEEKPVQQVSPLGGVEPKDEKEMVDTVRSFSKGGKRYGVQGLGTRYKITENETVFTKNLNQILDFDKGNLTIRVQSAASLETVRAEVEKAGQYLWVAGAGSVGGVIATKASAVPPLRDLILGMRVLLPTGDVVELGAKTMKNVAGYDVPKLLIGSWGTLGIILDVTFRLFPYPARELKVQTVQPFVFRDIHKKIKKAFDPNGFFGQRTTMLTASQIKPVKPQPDVPKTKEKEPPPPPQNKEPEVDRYGDGFWKS